MGFLANRGCAETVHVNQVGLSLQMDAFTLAAVGHEHIACGQLFPGTSIPWSIGRFFSKAWKIKGDIGAWGQTPTLGGPSAALVASHFVYQKNSVMILPLADEPCRSD